MEITVIYNALWLHLEVEKCKEGKWRKFFSSPYLGDVGFHNQKRKGELIEKIEDREVVFWHSFKKWVFILSFIINISFHFNSYSFQDNIFFSFKILQWRKLYLLFLKKLDSRNLSNIFGKGIFEEVVFLNYFRTVDAEYNCKSVSIFSKNETKKKKKKHAK